MSPSQASETCASASSATSANRKIIATQMLRVKRPGYASAQESSLRLPLYRWKRRRIEGLAEKAEQFTSPSTRADLYNRTKWNIFLSSPLHPLPMGEGSSI